MHVWPRSPWALSAAFLSTCFITDPCLACRWIDAGKFLTGFSAVGSIAIPAILFHAEKITGGALAMELAAVAVLAATAFAYDYLSNDDGSYYYQY